MLTHLPTKMVFVMVVLLMALSMAQLHPMACLEDYHCPDNFFCEFPTHGCRKCLDCTELNRLPSPNLESPNKCVKTEEDCGPCSERWGSRPVYVGVKCVPAPVKREPFLTKEFYIWCTGAGVAAGFLITVLFLRVFQSRVFKVVNCYIPVPFTGKEQWPGIVKSSLSMTKPSTEDESCLPPTVIKV